MPPTTTTTTTTTTPSTTTSTTTTSLQLQDCPAHLVPLVQDQYCHDEANILECQWDGGDCCDNMARYDNCTICKCKLGLTALEMPKCPHPELVGDGICHDFLNRGHCFYDGGDCCIRQDQFWYPQTNCTECKCRLGNPACPQRLRQKIQNGVCNDEVNIPECSFDGDDCCQRPATAEKCIPTCHASPWRRDKHCHPHLNNQRCGFDGMDCECMWRQTQGRPCAQLKWDISDRLNNITLAYNQCYMYHGKCVWYEKTYMTYNRAARHCATLGGRLWEPQSVKEYHSVNE